MPWFYFDVLHDGDEVTRDHKGIDLPDMVAAKIEALQIWKRVIRERDAGGRNPLHWNVAILNLHGTVLALVPYPADCDAWG
ncbi:DUF6894 family protein [Methylobacterium soli]|uniref:DUF6894 domain-containing protein n=1 Tax=Methylobacterium soli TaxID=553447 RepID=A0A6L3SSS5_9HYPH|nr:hypothetical protein [Methylobacterium soli]KAB1070802.1 hypothetical protein F6X53_29705 [Methylobacterium soli]GJE42428.1 hypothetical protein AEGHOMDF_1600 [Methylobacterium soli]